MRWLSIILIIVFLFIMILIVGYLFGCDAFQKKFYTEDGDETSLKVIYELCLKQGKQSDCNKLLEAITPAGRFEGYKNCQDWSQTANGRQSGVKCNILFNVPTGAK